MEQSAFSVICKNKLTGGNPFICKECGAGFVKKKGNLKNLKEF